MKYGKGFDKGLGKGFDKGSDEGKGKRFDKGSRATGYQGAFHECGEVEHKRAERWKYW